MQVVLSRDIQRVRLLRSINHIVPVMAEDIPRIERVEVHVQVMRPTRLNRAKPVLERNSHTLLYLQRQLLVDGHFHVGDDTHLIIDGIFLAARTQIIIDDGASDEENENG